MKGNELLTDRLQRAIRLLDLAAGSGYLGDRRGPTFGDVDASARVWSAKALVEQALRIQERLDARRGITDVPLPERPVGKVSG